MMRCWKLNFAGFLLLINGLIAVVAGETESQQRLSTPPRLGREVCSWYEIHATSCAQSTNERWKCIPRFPSLPPCIPLCHPLVTTRTRRLRDKTAFLLLSRCAHPWLVQQRSSPCSSNHPAPYVGGGGLCTAAVPKKMLTSSITEEEFKEALAEADRIEKDPRDWRKQIMDTLPTLIPPRDKIGTEPVKKLFTEDKDMEVTSNMRDFQANQDGLVEGGFKTEHDDVVDDTLAGRLKNPPKKKTIKIYEPYSSGKPIEPITDFRSGPLSYIDDYDPRTDRFEVRMVQTNDTTVGFQYPTHPFPVPLIDGDISTETKRVPENYKAPRPYKSSPAITVLTNSGWALPLQCKGRDRNKLISFGTPQEVMRMRHWEYLMKLVGNNRFVRLNHFDVATHNVTHATLPQLKHSQNRLDYITRLMHADKTGMWNHLVERGLDSIINIPSPQKKLESFRHYPLLTKFYKLRFDGTPPGHLLEPVGLQSAASAPPYHATQPYSSVFDAAAAAAAAAPAAAAAAAVHLRRSELLRDGTIALPPFGNLTFSNSLSKATIDHIEYLKLRYFNTTNYPGGIGMATEDFADALISRPHDLTYYNYPGPTASVLNGSEKPAETIEELTRQAERDGDKKAPIIAVMVDGVVHESLSEGLNNLPDGLFVGSIHSLQDPHYNGTVWPQIDVRVWTNTSEIVPNEIPYLGIKSSTKEVDKAVTSQLFPGLVIGNETTIARPKFSPAPLKAIMSPTHAELRRQMFEMLHWIPEFSNWGKKNTQPFVKGQIGRISTKFDNDYPIFDYRKHDFGMAKFSAWNQIGLVDALCISLQPNRTIDIPIHVLQYFTNNSTASAGNEVGIRTHPLVHPRVVVQVGNYSRLAIHQSQHGDGGTVNSVTRAVVGECGTLTHTYLQAMTNRTWHWENMSVKTEPFAQYFHQGVQLGGLVSRHNFQLECGLNATHGIYGVSLPFRRQQLQRYDMFHIEYPDTTVRQLQKFLIGTHSSGTWRCRSRVERNGHRTDLHTLIRCVMLGPGASIFTVPSLEIIPPDVTEATHGAAISGLDTGPLYYFTVRGIDSKLAELVNMRMFASENYCWIPDRRIQRMIDKKVMDMPCTEADPRNPQEGLLRPIEMHTG